MTPTDKTPAVSVTPEITHDMALAVAKRWFPNFPNHVVRKEAWGWNAMSKVSGGLGLPQYMPDAGILDTWHCIVQEEQGGGNPYPFHDAGDGLLSHEQCVDNDLHHAFERGRSSLTVKQPVNTEGGFSILDIQKALQVGVNIGMQNMDVTEVAGTILPDFKTTLAISECMDYLKNIQPLASQVKQGTSVEGEGATHWISARELRDVFYAHYSGLFDEKQELKGLSLVEFIRAMKSLSAPSVVKQLALRVEDLIRYDTVKPPKGKTVLLVWWHRNGIEASQKCLALVGDDGKLIPDVNYSGAGDPTFWHPLFNEGMTLSIVKQEDNSIRVALEAAKDEIKRRIRDAYKRVPGFNSAKIKVKIEENKTLRLIESALSSAVRSEEQLGVATTQITELIRVAIHDAALLWSDNDNKASIRLDNFMEIVKDVLSGFTVSPPVGLVDAIRKMEGSYYTDRCEAEMKDAIGYEGPWLQREKVLQVLTEYVAHDK